MTTTTETKPRELSWIFSELAGSQQRARPVVKSSVNAEEEYLYASAEVVVGEGKAALAGSNLSVVRTRAVFAGAPGALVLESTFLLSHPAGEQLEFETTWPVSQERGRPVDRAGASALTSSLAYFLRDLLLLPRVLEGEEMDAPREGKASKPAKPQRPEKPVNLSAEVAGLREQIRREIANLPKERRPKAWQAHTAAGADLVALRRLAAQVLRVAQNPSGGGVGAPAPASPSAPSPAAPSVVPAAETAPATSEALVPGRTDQGEEKPMAWCAVCEGADPVGPCLCGMTEEEGRAEASRFWTAEDARRVRDFPPPSSSCCRCGLAGAALTAVPPGKIHPDECRGRSVAPCDGSERHAVCPTCLKAFEPETVPVIPPPARGRSPETPTAPLERPPLTESDVRTALGIAPDAPDGEKAVGSSTHQDTLKTGEVAQQSVGVAARLVARPNLGEWKTRELWSSVGGGFALGATKDAPLRFFALKGGQLAEVLRQVLELDASYRQLSGGAS